VDAELAVRQWQRYVDALESTGWTTVEVPAIDECPDGVFIEDTMVVYGGLGGRTNDEGIRQLREALAPLGADVRAVPVRKVLHLKSAVTALPDGTVIGYEPLVDDQAAFDRFRAVPEEAGSHVVLLGEDRLLMAASAPKSAELFEELGYTPVAVDISEFEKL